jgi:hypothetical protein
MADIKKKPVITVKKKDGSYVHVPLDQFKPENITRASSGDFSSPLQESLPSNQSNNNPLTSENRVSQVNAILKQISFPIPQQFENRLRSIVQLYLKDIKGQNETEEVLMRKVEEGGLGLSDQQATEVIRHCDETMLPQVYQEPGLPAISVKSTFVKNQPSIKSSTPANMNTKISLDIPKKKAVDDLLSQQHEETPFKFTPKPVNRPIMRDIISKSVETGPVEELGEMSLLDFRRLSHQPAEAAARLGQKITNLKDESILFYLTGLEAWRKSPLYTDYITSLVAAVAQKKQLATILSDKQKIQLSEVEALVNMEKTIVQ